jgi:predicted nucleotidyltransferase
MTPHIPIPQAQIVAFCQKWKITEFSLFGSVMRDDFGPESDVDVLVGFEPDVSWGLLGLVRMERELASLFGRKVDLVIRKSIERSDNQFRRNSILAHPYRIYGS